MTKKLTDYELVEAAEKLTRHNTKDDLPVRYTFADLLIAEEGLNRLAQQFIEKHGSRLESLSPGLYAQLKSWNY